MKIISGPEQRSSRFLDCKIDTRVSADRRLHAPPLGLCLIGGFLLACSAPPISAFPTVQLAPDRQAILVIPSDRATSSQLPLQNLPTESSLAPGLSYHPQRFDLVRVSPDGRYAAFSTVGHHNLIGLLHLAAMTVREIDIVTEGDVVAFHWAADGRTLAYDYLPARGYRRVKGYDVESREGLVVPRKQRYSASQVTFAGWGQRPREIILRVTDELSNEGQTETVTLVPRQ